MGTVVGCTVEWPAALTEVAGATPWKADTGATIGAAVVATTGTAATPTAAPAGGMGSGCVPARARPTTGMAVTIEVAGDTAADAVLGCTEAVGTVGGAKREQVTQ